MPRSQTVEVDKKYVSQMLQIGNESVSLLRQGVGPAEAARAIMSQRKAFFFHEAGR